MSYLVQILLPIYDNDGNKFPSDFYASARSELAERFGGLTAYTRAPAEGLWASGGQVKRDDIVVLEVMIERLDRQWWRAYREELERRFRQDQIVVRANTYEPL